MTDNFRTFTLVVRMPEDDRFDIGLVDDPRGLFTDDEVMFWGSEGGITPQAIDLGADPTLWADDEDDDDESVTITSIARLTEVLDAEGEEVRASMLGEGDLYAEFGMEPRVILRRGDHGSTVLLTHDDLSTNSLDDDEVVQRVPAGRF